MEKHTRCSQRYIHSIINHEYLTNKNGEQLNLWDAESESGIRPDQIEDIEPFWNEFTGPEVDLVLEAFRRYWNDSGEWQDDPQPFKSKNEWITCAMGIDPTDKKQAKLARASGPRRIYREAIESLTSTYLRLPDSVRKENSISLTGFLPDPERKRILLYNHGGRQFSFMGSVLSIEDAGPAGFRVHVAQPLLYRGGFVPVPHHITAQLRKAKVQRVSVWMHKMVLYLCSLQNARGNKGKPFTISYEKLLKRSGLHKAIEHRNRHRYLTKYNKDGNPIPGLIDQFLDTLNTMKLISQWNHAKKGMLIIQLNPFFFKTAPESVGLKDAPVGLKDAPVGLKDAPKTGNLHRMQRNTGFKAQNVGL